VTHHVEEIPPAFGHVLVMREGRVLAAGPKNRILRDALLSEAFGAPVRISRTRGRYSMRVKTRADGLRVC
jgi:iron complex transport system ATP-binding protein